jgi:hypothetical protein
MIVLEPSPSARNFQGCNTVQCRGWSGHGRGLKTWRLSQSNRRIFEQKVTELTENFFFRLLARRGRALPGVEKSIYQRAPQHGGLDENWLRPRRMSNFNEKTF